VNGSTFEPDDEILFKRGETWTGTTLTVPSSGVVGHPITFGAYGTGALPLIDGNDAVLSCINTNGMDYLIFENIATAQGLSYGFYINASDYITMTDCESSDCGSDNVKVEGGAHHVSILGGTYYDVYERVPPVCGGNIDCEEDCHDILIDGVESYGANGSDTHGINFHNHVGTNMMYNITIQNCTVYNNSHSGIYVWKQDDTANANLNVLVAGNTCYNNGAHEINVLSSGAAKLRGITIRDNICRNTAGAGVRAIRTRDIQDAEIYRNLFHADRVLPVWIEDNVDADWWNNTIYTTAAVTSSWLVWIQGADTENLVFQNNIIEAEDTSPYMINIVVGTGVLGLDIDYNLYGYTGVGTRWTWLGAAKTWASWKTDSGQDANSPTPADPLFTNPGAGDFTLQAGSPAINAGVDVGLSYCGTAPDCGAYERC